MFEQMLQDDLSLLALPVYLAAILLEAGYSRRHHLHRYRLGDTLASLSMLVASAVVELLPRLLALAIFFQLHELSPLRDVIGRQWWAWLLLFLLDDFTYYWFHRANHEVRLLWAGHVNHHSSQYLNFGTALRQGVGERVHKFLFWLWLPLLGFDPAMIVTVIGVNLFYQFWVHTQAVGKLQYPLPPPGAPRFQCALPGSQPRRGADCLGPAVRHFQRGAGRRARGLRTHHQYRLRQPLDRAQPRVPRHRPRPAPRHDLG